MWSLFPCTALVLALAQLSISQTIADILSTTSDQSQRFQKLDNAAIEFTDPGATGAADITVDRSSKYQTMAGVGGTLSDSGAKILDGLKGTNSDEYWNLISYLFDPTDGADAAGISYLRITLGASDFSAGAYSYDDIDGDTEFSSFDINASPEYLFSVLTDILSVNDILKIHLTPWSPPAWMKDSTSMLGGSLKEEYVEIYANYLLKCVQGFTDKGAPVYAINVQNEPENNNPTYPTATLTPETEARIGESLRTLLNSNGFSDIKLIGYDHNWADAGAYPSELMAASDSFDGVSFHCYAGSPLDVETFRNSYPNKEIYFNECTGELNSDWWSDIKWNMDNIFIGGAEQNSKTGLLWNVVLDGSGEPRFPGTDSCTAGCRGIATVNADGTWSVNQEFYAIAHMSKGFIPTSSGGPFGQRISTTVGGGSSWALRVVGFETGSRYSLVVLNWNDSGSPGAVTTTINFEGRQATYNFPLGLTTLWWTAESGKEDNDRRSLNFSREI